MSFESLEDNFMKKVNEPVKTDVQQTADMQKTAADSENKETYEDNLTKKQAIGGLAALFQETIKNSNADESSNSDTTVFISTDNIRYGDNFTDPTNYVDEKDIQKFMPGDTYNESIKEPDLDKGEVQFDQKHSPGNKYDDNLSIEPNVAKESDIHRQGSISKSVNADEPYSDEDMLNKIGEHNKKKQKQFSENTWSSDNAYTGTPQIDTNQVITQSTEDTSLGETELSEDEHTSSIRDPRE